MTAPLIPVAGTFAAGIWLGLETASPGWLSWVGGGLAALVIVAALRGHLAAASAGALLLVGLAGWARVGLPDPLPAITGLQPGVLRVEGLVSGDPEREGPRTRLPFLLQAVVTEAASTPASGQSLVHLYGVAPPLTPGERVRLTVRVSEPRPFRNPGSGDSDLRVSPSRPHFLLAGRAESIERLPAGNVPWWLRIRLWVHRVVQREFPAVSGALFEGLLIGERRQLPPTLLADFRAAGVFHILAISGFNVGLVAGTVLFLLRFIRLPPRVAAGVTLGTLGAFATIVGAQPSVLRATVMGGLILAAHLLGRESRVWNSFAAALVVLLALEPNSLTDPGLQLSFGATAGILHLSPPIFRLLERRWPRPLASAVAVSAGAQLMVTPLMLAHWSQLSLVGVVANLVVVPLAGALTMLGFLALLVAAVSEGVAHLAFQSLWALLLVLRLIVRAFGALPGAVVYPPSPPPLALAASAAALLIAPVMTGIRGGAALLGLAGLAIITTGLGYLPDGRIHVVVLDVGQGDAILVRGPDGQTLVVDTGGGGSGRSDRGERVVLPLLRRMGVRRLAALALTHGDPDHSGGLVGLLEGIPIDEVWIAPGTEGAEWQRPLVAAGVRRHPLARGDRIWLGPLLVTVLHPARADPAGNPPRPTDSNNGSLMLRVEWGLLALVLTGDAEEPAESEVLAAASPLRAPLLKVGHHGSRHGSSPRFLAAVGPRFALVSVGARNPFGHPNPALLARLAEAGASIHRTDLDGAIEITSDGQSLWVRDWARRGIVEEFLLRAAP